MEIAECIAVGTRRAGAEEEGITGSEVVGYMDGLGASEAAMIKG